MQTTPRLRLTLGALTMLLALPGVSLAQGRGHGGGHGPNGPRGPGGPAGPAVHRGAEGGSGNGATSPAAPGDAQGRGAAVPADARNAITERLRVPQTVGGEPRDGAAPLSGASRHHGLGTIHAEGPSTRPPGWDRGRKKGWDGAGEPPGLERARQRSPGGVGSGTSHGDSRSGRRHLGPASGQHPGGRQAGAGAQRHRVPATHESGKGADHGAGQQGGQGAVHGRP